MRPLLPLVVLASLTACAAPTSRAKAQAESGWEIRIGEAGGEPLFTHDGRLGMSFAIDATTSRDVSAAFESGMAIDAFVLRLHDFLAQNLGPADRSGLQRIEVADGPDRLRVPASFAGIHWQDSGPQDGLPSLMVVRCSGATDA